MEPTEKKPYPVTVSQEVYAAIRDRAITPVLDPEFWQDLEEGKETYTFYVDEDVREALGDDPETVLRQKFGIAATEENHGS